MFSRILMFVTVVVVVVMCFASVNAEEPEESQKMYKEMTRNFIPPPFIQEKYDSLKKELSINLLQGQKRQDILHNIYVIEYEFKDYSEYKKGYNHEIYPFFEQTLKNKKMINAISTLFIIAGTSGIVLNIIDANREYEKENVKFKNKWGLNHTINVGYSSIFLITGITIKVKL